MRTVRWSFSIGSVKDIVNLLNRRKQLIQAKKQKMQWEYQRRAKEIQAMSKEELCSEELKSVVNSSHELQCSQEFWVQNKSLEQETDALIGSVRSLDKCILAENDEMKQLCEKMDELERAIRELLIQKQSAQAEPVFIQKQSLQDELTQKTKLQNQRKQEKCNLIHKVMAILSHLCDLRQSRLTRINKLFNGTDKY